MVFGCCWVTVSFKSVRAIFTPSSRSSTRSRMVLSLRLAVIGAATGGKYREAKGFKMHLSVTVRFVCLFVCFFSICFEWACQDF